MSKSLEFFISTPHWLDALTPPLERHLEYLAETLRRLVKPDELSVEPVPPPRPVPSSRSASSSPPTHTQVRTPESSRRLIVAGAAVGVIAAIALAAYAFYPRGPVERGLVGSWTGQTTVNGLPIVVESKVESDGRGVVTSTLRDQGRFQSGRGRWTMTNAAGQTMYGTYAFTSDRTMSMTGPLGTASWTRDPSSPADPAGRLAGTWRTTGTAPDGLPATTTLIFASDGTYQFAASSEDTSSLQARNGRWRSVSSTTGTIAEGTYELRGPGAPISAGA